MPVHRTPGPDRLEALGSIKRDLDAFSLAPPIREKVRNHYEDLAKLAASLQKLGIDDHEIEQHVTEIFGNYRAQLMRSIEQMKPGA